MVGKGRGKTITKIYFFKIGICLRKQTLITRKELRNQETTLVKHALPTRRWEPSCRYFLHSKTKERNMFGKTMQEMKTKRIAVLAWLPWSQLNFMAPMAPYFWACHSTMFQSMRRLEVSFRKVIHFEDLGESAETMQQMLPFTFAPSL